MKFSKGNFKVLPLRKNGFRHQDKLRNDRLESNFAENRPGGHSEHQVEHKPAMYPYYKESQQPPWLHQVKRGDPSPLLHPDVMYLECWVQS